MAWTWHLAGWSGGVFGVGVRVVMLRRRRGRRRGRGRVVSAIMGMRVVLVVGVRVIVVRGMMTRPGALLVLALALAMAIAFPLGWVVVWSHVCACALGRAGARVTRVAVGWLVGRMRGG